MKATLEQGVGTPAASARARALLLKRKIKCMQVVPVLSWGNLGTEISLCYLLLQVMGLTLLDRTVK